MAGNNISFVGSCYATAVQGDAGNLVREGWLLAFAASKLEQISILLSIIEIDLSLYNAHKQKKARKMLGFMRSGK